LSWTQDELLLPQDGGALPQGQPFGARDAAGAAATHGLWDDDSRTPLGMVVINGYPLVICHIAIENDHL